MTSNALIIAALKRVPEKKLRLIEMAGRLVGKDGSLDFERIQDMKAEVNLARAEAIRYCRATNEAVAALRSLPPRTGGEL